MYVCDIRRDIFAAHWRLTILSFEIRQISMESCSVELPQSLGEALARVPKNIRDTT